MNKTYFILSLLSLCFMLPIYSSQESIKHQAYKTLGLKSGEHSQQDITKKYRMLARRWHPDRNANSEESKKKFQGIGAAYELLHREKSENLFKLASGLSFDQIFHMQGLIRNINTIISTEKDKNYLSSDIIEQNLPVGLSEANYKEELKIKVELFKKIRTEKAQYYATTGESYQKVQSVNVSRSTVYTAQIMLIIKEMNRGYMDRGLIPNFSYNPITLTIEQAKIIYEEEMILANALKEIKDIIEKYPQYIKQEAKSHLLLIRSMINADSFLHQIKGIVSSSLEETRQEQEKIKSIFEDIKEIRRLSGLIGNLPDPSKVNVAWAEEARTDIKFFVQCFNDVKNAMSGNKHNFSSEFLKSIPSSLSSSNHAKEILNKINKEIEILRIEREIKVVQDEFICTMEENKNYVSPQFKSNLLEKFVSIDQSTKIRSELNVEIILNQKKRIRQLHDNKIKYQSVARFGLSPLIKKKLEDQLKLDLDYFEENYNEDLFSSAKLRLQSAEQDEKSARRAQAATICTGLGLVVSMTGLATHLYYKNK